MGWSLALRGDGDHSMGTCSRGHALIPDSGSRRMPSHPFTFRREGVQLVDPCRTCSGAGLMAGQGARVESRQHDQDRREVLGQDRRAALDRIAFRQQDLPPVRAVGQPSDVQLSVQIGDEPSWGPDPFT